MKDFGGCFLSCDWGTTNFRLRLLNLCDGSVLAEVQSADGVAALNRLSPTLEGRAALFEEILLKYASELEGRSGRSAEWCVVSGMATSRIGWKELPYKWLEASLTGEDLIREVLTIGEIRNRKSVVLVSGLSTGSDVLRGEEAELVGLALLNPSIAREVCTILLPGTHSKHVQLNMGRITGFRTLMTGEMFSHLHSMPTLGGCLAWNNIEAKSEAFRGGVLAASDPGLVASLFSIRSRSLLDGRSNQENTAFLSGLLIGSELALIPNRSKVYLVVGPELESFYVEAARILGHLQLETMERKIAQNAIPLAHRAILLSLSENCS